MGTIPIICCAQRERDEQPKSTRADSNAFIPLQGMALREIDKVFDELDIDSNGTLSKGEFRQAKAKLRDMGYDMDFMEEFDYFDSNHDGSVDRVEFRTAVKNQATQRCGVLQQLTEHSPEFNDTVDALWKDADEDGNGTVDAYELCNFINHVEEKLSENKNRRSSAQGLLKRFDVNGDGVLQKHEFKSMMEETFMDLILGRVQDE